ncbi:MAG: DNA-3-methyladenine glycosylase 2 family protein [Acidobacteria bacterium]|nr:DNA-3-methyladenine glycosylase 2 family protein [Acidobacteriota bacterium]
MIFDDKLNVQSAVLLQTAARELAQADAAMAAIIRQVGPCQLRMTWRSHYFRALVEAIIYQQLSGKAASAILARFRALYPSHRFPLPQEILGTPASKLRAVGLSKQKISYIQDLAARAASGAFLARRLAALADEQVIAHLTEIKGIGRWTAEMFLIFCLGRPDVLSPSDLGIRKAVQKAYAYKSLPSPRTVERHGQRWKPYRSIACWYLWASVDGAAPGPASREP